MKDVSLIEISSPGCHNCAQFQAFWEKEKDARPNVVFREVSLMSPDAREFISKFRILASPALIINGEMYSSGPVDTVALKERLDELSKE